MQRSISQQNRLTVNPVTDSIHTRFEWRTFVLRERYPTCGYPRGGKTTNPDFPKSIEGLKLLLQSDRGVIDTLDLKNDNNGRITWWKDQSGNNNHAYQFDPALKPLFPYYHPARHNGVFFRGGTYLNTSLPVKSNTVIIAIRNDSGSFFGTGPHRLLLNGGTSATLSLTPAGTLASFDGIDQFFEYYTINKMSTNSFVSAPDSHKVLIATAAAWSGNSTQSWGIGKPGIGSNGWDGHIFELMIYNRVLSQSELDTLYGYLRDKYLLYPTCYDTLGYKPSQDGEYARDAYYEFEVVSSMPDTVSFYKQTILPKGGGFDTLITKVPLVNLATDTKTMDAPLTATATSAQGTTMYYLHAGVYASYFEGYFFGKSQGKSVRGHTKHTLYIKYMRRR